MEMIYYGKRDGERLEKEMQGLGASVDNIVKSIIKTEAFIKGIAFLYVLEYFGLKDTITLLMSKVG